MVKVESVLKWKVGGSLLKKIKLLRKQILSKNPDAVALPDDQLHVTLASGDSWKSVRKRAKAADFDEPDFDMDIEPSIRTKKEGPQESWYVRMKNLVIAMIRQKKFLMTFDITKIMEISSHARHGLHSARSKIAS